MAEQVSDAVDGTGPAAGAGSPGAVAHGVVAHLEHNPGRAVAWVGTTVVVIGFIVGGIAFIPSPHWAIVIVGAVIAVVGLLILQFSGAMNRDWY